jgi:antitoxin component YwqK of YwqJK toxin-antitoxin module
MKKYKLLFLSVLFLLTNYINAQVYYNTQDSLYYTDSDFREVCDNIIGFRDTIWTDRNQESFSYILNDSLIYHFDKGNIKKMIKYDIDKKYKIFEFSFSNNQIEDGIYEVHKRNYSSEKIYSEKITRINYLDGRRNGVVYRFWTDEPSRIISLSSYKNDSLNGYSAEFKSNGLLLKEEFFKSGYLDGFERTYYENIPQIKYEANYDRGLAEGFLRVWWENGKLKGQAEYRKGKKDGVSEVYLKSGELAFVQYYKHGKLLKTEFYKNVDKLPSLFVNEFLKYPDYTKSEVIKKY